MIGSLFKSRKNKKFNYQPRYYNPKEEERRRRRLNFKRISKRKKSQPMMVFALAVALFFILWLISQLSQI